MGGFYNALGKVVTEGVEKVGSKLFSSSFGHEAAEATERGLYHSIFPAKAAFQDIPVAKTLFDAYEGPYKELANKYTSEGVRQAKILANSKPSHEIEREAQQKAQTEVFGQNRVAIQGVLKHVEKTVSKNRADLLADHLNVLFKEAPDKQGLSKFDRDMRHIPKGASELEGYDTPPSKYRGTSFLEANITRKHQALLAYKAAIPHLASNLNILISDGFVNYAKVVATAINPTTRKGAEAAVLATNAISELFISGYREKLAFDNGVISKFAPGSVGEFVHRNMYIPGMSRVRYETLLMSANASKLAAEEAANHLAQGNKRMALPMFKELGLDPTKIQAQGFKLDPDDIQKAYYHGTDFRAFLNFAEHRSEISQRSPLFRIAGAFHNYVSRQSRFFGQVFKRQYQQGDFVGIARNIGLLGMAFPLVGATIYETERLLTGNDWDAPLEHYKNRMEATPAGQVFDAMAGRENAAGAARTSLNTLENLSHVAAFGTVTGYMRGASRANLAGQILGPDINMGSQAIQDAWKAGHTDNRHPDSWKALARDAMSDLTPYGTGAIASHQLLPTKAEASKDKPKRFRRTKPKEESWNPLNSNDFKY